MMLYACITGVLSFMWVHYMTGDVGPFGWVPRLLGHYNAPEWAHKLLHDCSVCISGQLALWGYLAYMTPVRFTGYSLTDHATLVAGAMLTAHLLEQLLTYVHGRNEHHQEN